MNKESSLALNCVLVALPGTGKTTTLRTILGDNSSVKILELDSEIKKRLKAEDHIAIKFLDKYPNISSDVFTPKDGKSISSTIMKEYGEEKWRELEGDYATDIIEGIGKQDEGKKTSIDLGGKMFLNDKVRQTLKSKGIVSIYLYADKDTIRKHLLKNDNWTKRSNYRNAGEKGWRDLVDQHYLERTDDMRNLTSVAIDVSNKSSQDMAKEILYSLHEYEVLRPKFKESYKNFSTISDAEEKDGEKRWEDVVKLLKIRKEQMGKCS